MKEQNHLPMYGVGPMYVIVCVLATVTGILLTKAGLLNTGNIAEWKILCIITGILLIIAGAYLWIASVLIQKVQKNIEENRLATTGVYAWVRNPIYSGIVMVLTGILLLFHNVWLLVLPLFFWLFMTLLMKATEEKWLKEMYGKEYEDYCKKVNRCIPWFPKR